MKFQRGTASSSSSNCWSSFLSSCIVSRRARVCLILVPFSCLLLLLFTHTQLLLHQPSSLDQLQLQQQHHKLSSNDETDGAICECNGDATASSQLQTDDEKQQAEAAQAEATTAWIDRLQSSSQYEIKRSSLSSSSFSFSFSMAKSQSSPVVEDAAFQRDFINQFKQTYQFMLDHPTFNDIPAEGRPLITSVYFPSSSSYFPSSSSSSSSSLSPSPPLSGGRHDLNEVAVGMALLLQRRTQLLIHSLGRFKTSTDRQIHRLSLVQGPSMVEPSLLNRSPHEHVELGSVTIDMSTCVPDAVGFCYAPLRSDTFDRDRIVVRQRSGDAIEQKLLYVLSQESGLIDSDVWYGGVESYEQMPRASIDTSLNIIIFGGVMRRGNHYQLTRISGSLHGPVSISASPVGFSVG